MNAQIFDISAYTVIIIMIGLLLWYKSYFLDETTDIYKDIISGFKDGEDRPNFSILMTKLELGEYQQVLFSEFSRLERKPTNLLRDLEKFQSLGVYAWFSKQNLWVRYNNDLGTQIMIHILAVMSQYEI